MIGEGVIPTRDGVIPAGRDLCPRGGTRIRGGKPQFCLLISYKWVSKFGPKSLLLTNVGWKNNRKKIILRRRSFGFVLRSSGCL